MWTFSLLMNSSLHSFALIPLLATKRRAVTSLPFKQPHSTLTSTCINTSSNIVKVLAIELWIKSNRPALRYAYVAQSVFHETLELKLFQSETVTLLKRHDQNKLNKKKNIFRHSQLIHSLKMIDRHRTSAEQTLAGDYRNKAWCDCLLPIRFFFCFFLQSHFRSKRHFVGDSHGKAAEASSRRPAAAWSSVTAVLLEIAGSWRLQMAQTFDWSADQSHDTCSLELSARISQASHHLLKCPCGDAVEALTLTRCDLKTKTQ